MTPADGGAAGVSQSGIWHRGWLISKSFMGWAFQHPAFDPEKADDWRYGTADSVEDARTQIDDLLEESAEWDEAARFVRGCFELASAMLAEQAA